MPEVYESLDQGRTTFLCETDGKDGQFVKIRYGILMTDSMRYFVWRSISFFQLVEAHYT
jgi:hypothetical protein